MVRHLSGSKNTSRERESTRQRLFAFSAPREPLELRPSYGSTDLFPSFFVMLHYAGEEQWETDCSVDMHSALFSLRVKLPPRLAFGELTPGQPAELGVISRYLDRIAVRGNGHPGNLCHRDDLLDIVFRCPATDENDARPLPSSLEAHNLKIVQHRVVDHCRPSLVKLLVPIHS